MTLREDMQALAVLPDQREAAKRGAAFLDERAPGWADRVRLRNLNLAQSRFCVLGQLCGSFGNGKEQFNLTQADVYRLGFDKPHGVGLYYGPLQETWKDEIRARRQARS